MIAVISSTDVLDDPGPVGLLLQRPLSQIARAVCSETHTVAGVFRGQVHTVQFEGVHIVRYMNGHISHRIGLAQLSVRDGGGQAGKFGTDSSCRQSHTARGMIDHDLAALAGGGGELIDRDGLFRSAAGFHFPELQCLAGNVRRKSTGVGSGVAAPVLVVINTQIAPGIVAVDRGQVIVCDGPDMPDAGFVADADPVIGRSNIQILAVGVLDDITALFRGDGPAEGGLQSVCRQFSVAADRTGIGG